MPRPSALPPWLSTAAVAWVGAALALASLALAGGFLWFEQRELAQRELQSAEMLARVLQDHADRTFDLLDVTLGTVADTVAADTHAARSGHLNAVMAQAQQGRPFLRSLSLINGAGRVLASSTSANLGIQVDLQRLLLPADAAPERLGTLLHGRDLADLSLGGGAAPAANPVAGTRSFVPLVRRVAGAPGLFVVAALNTDFFANAYELTLADRHRAAALLGMDGVLLVSSENIHLPAGSSAAAHPFFAHYLPARESGSFVGAGLDGKPALSAFRLLRKWPVAVVVECDRARVYAALLPIAGWVAGACVLSWALVAATVALGWRSLRSHAAVEHKLQAARDRVADNERDLRTLVESVQELIFRTDPRGRITFVNARWAQITGRPEAAALGRHLAELCQPQGQAAVLALFTPDRAGPSVATRVQITGAQGEPRTLAVSVAAVLAGDGMLQAYAGFAVDVTEREHARRALEAQLGFTARLLDVSPTPFFVKDELGRFVTVNQAWLDLMGLAPAAVIGSNSAVLFGAEVQSHQQTDQAVLTTEHAVRYENRLTRPDHTVRDTIVTKVRFTQADGSPAGIVGSIIDVTEFREAERLTREAQAEAEAANRAKSEFIANISHELRTPLQAIIGFSEMGAELPLSADESREMFGDIQAGGRRMLRLVNDLLDVSKMESTVGSLALERLDLVELADDVAHELKPIAAKRGLLIELGRPAAEVLADVDPFRMQQVIRNVLANAIRFSPEGGCIRIDCAARADGGAEIAIRDQGSGVPADELESIFEAFVQSTRTSDGAGGTGLGLTICRKIMSAHGGCISASNAPEGGALIRIVLPAFAAAPAAAAQTPAAAPHRAGSPALADA